MKKEIKFSVLGEPFSKQRHRTTKAGHNYTPEQTVSHENFIKMLYIEQGGGVYLEGPLGITIHAYFKTPSKPSRPKLLQMLSGLLRPTKKPDWDNMGKIVCDSLNAIAFDDDKQFVESHVYKRYSDRPRLHIRMWELSDEELMRAADDEGQEGKLK